MGAASTIPVEATKPGTDVDVAAQPKVVFIAATNTAKESSVSLRENKDTQSRLEESKGPSPMKRKYSLELMLPQPMKSTDDSSGGSSWPDNVGKTRIEVGDVVRFALTKGSTVDGLVIEILGPSKVLVDCGEFNKEINPDDCELITKVMDFEEGDKVEVKPAESQLYFVGKVIRVHTDKTMDVLMDGDDPDDIEFKVSPDNARKLMSRRALVVNRWKRAFMLVLAANFFRRIHFYPESKAHESVSADILSDEKC